MSVLKLSKTRRKKTLYRDSKNYKLNSKKQTNTRETISIKSERDSSIEERSTG